MKLHRNPVLRHPAFVIISAQPELVLFICDHPPVNHTKSSVFRSINTAIKHRFETLPGDIILALRHALNFFAFRRLVHQHSNTSDIAQSPG